MEEIKRDTVGALSSELLLKAPETRDPIEIQREVHKKEFEENIYKAIHTGKKYFKSPFYIVVMTKKERLMQNVLRNYFIPRQSCPFPNWDESVYRYTDHDERIEYLWTIPDKQTCQLLKENALIVAPEERWLLQMVLDFSDGTLDTRARILNGELDVV